MTSVPTVVAWDGVESMTSAPEPEVDEDDVWDGMEDIEDSGDESKERKRRRKTDERTVQ